MPHELPKAYEPGAIEARWAEYWVQEKLFHVETPAAGDSRPVFTLLLPPPNVTGRLHMGHMLNQTQMDIVVRWHRMRGHVALWLPGTDHAGIATQMMVERQLAKEGKKRREMGREDFVKRVNEITEGKKVPVVYDSVGKDTFLKSLDCLAPLGVAALFGQSSGSVEPLNLGLLAAKGSLYVTRPTLNTYAAKRENLVAMAKELFDVVKSGAVKIEVHQTYPLKDAAKAHADLAARKTTGSTVLTV